MLNIISHERNVFKITLRYNYTQTRMVKIKKNHTNCWGGCGVVGAVIRLLLKRQNGVSTLTNSLAICCYKRTLTV